MRYRWGVVALGVVAVKYRWSQNRHEKDEKDTEKDTKRTKRTDINRVHKNPQHRIALWKSIRHIYETPEILYSMILSTVSCLQSDNDVSTSNIDVNGSSRTEVDGLNAIVH